MAQYQIKYDKGKCQSNFVCTAVDPDHFKEADDGKAELIGGSSKGDTYTLDVDESEKEVAQQAAKGCPMLAIELIDQESGETFAP